MSKALLCAFDSVFKLLNPVMPENACPKPLFRIHGGLNQLRLEINWSLLDEQTPTPPPAKKPANSRRRRRRKRATAKSAATTDVSQPEKSRKPVTPPPGFPTPQREMEMVPEPPETRRCLTPPPGIPEPVSPELMMATADPSGDASFDPGELNSPGEKQPSPEPTPTPSPAQAAR